MKCNCGKEFKLPASYIGKNKNGIPLVRYKCTCGWDREVPMDTLPSYTSERSGNVNLSTGEYFRYKKGKIKFACPICKRFQFIVDPKLVIDGDKVSLNIACDNGCGFKTDVILKDYDK